MSLFDAAVAFVLRHEGGYSRDSDDPGGETNWGISKRAYPALDIAELTREEAVELYRADYWRAARCDDLPGQVALLVFDAAVNQGLGAAVTMLQDELGVATDGVLGPLTLAAATSRNHDDLALGYCARRAMRYATTKNLDRYGRGWYRGLLDAYRTALGHG